MRSGRLNDILDEILVTSSDEDSPPKKPTTEHIATVHTEDITPSLPPPSAPPPETAEAVMLQPASRRESDSGSDEHSSRARPIIRNIATDSDSDEIPARRERPKRVTKAFVVDDDSPQPAPDRHRQKQQLEESSAPLTSLAVPSQDDGPELTPGPEVRPLPFAASSSGDVDEQLRQQSKQQKSVTFLTEASDPPCQIPPTFLPNTSLDVEGHELIDVLAKGIAEYRGVVLARPEAVTIAPTDVGGDSSIEIEEEDQAEAHSVNPVRQFHTKAGTPSKSPYSFVTMSSDEKKRHADDSPASMFTFETASTGDAGAAAKTSNRTAPGQGIRKTAPQAPREKLFPAESKSEHSMQDMYEAAVRARERKLRRYDEERRRRESLLQKECSFTPQISSAAKEIKRARSAVPHCYEDAKSFKIWLMQQKRTDDEQLTFEPEINERSRTLINKWRSASSRPALSADARLYEDGKRRLANLEAAANVQPPSVAPTRSTAEILSLVEHLQSYAAKKDELLQRLRQREDARHRPVSRRVDPAAVVERLVSAGNDRTEPAPVNSDLTFEPRLSFVSHTIAERKKVEVVKLWFYHLSNGASQLPLPIYATCRVSQLIDAALAAARVTSGAIELGAFVSVLQRHEQRFGPQLWSHTEPSVRPPPPARRFVPQISEESRRLAAGHGHNGGHVFNRLYNMKPCREISEESAALLTNRSTSTDLRASRHIDANEQQPALAPNEPSSRALQKVADVTFRTTIRETEETSTAVEAEGEDILSELQRAIAERALEQVSASQPRAPVCDPAPATESQRSSAICKAKKNDTSKVLEPGKVDLLLECAKARYGGGIPAKEKNARLRQLGRSLINQQLY